MQIFWRLILAHLLADFTLQTNFIAQWKRKNVWGVLTHSLIFALCAGVLCFSYLADVWVRFGSSVVIQGWTAIVLVTIFHFFEDEWRVWTIQRLKSPDSFLFFIWDQFIHYILIFVVSPQQNGFYPEKGILLAIIAVVATHFTAIFVYYMELDIFGRAAILAREKYYAMAERAAIILCIMLPGWWAFCFPLVWLGRFGARQRLFSTGFSWVNTAVSGFLAVLFGIFARLIYYA